MKRELPWWVPLAIIYSLAALIIGCLSPYPVQAAELAKLQTQALYPVAQLNRTCSATFIHSSRDEKSGEVSTYLLTAKHCIQSPGLLQTVYVPVYKSGRLVKEDAYVAKVKGVYSKGDLALVELLDKDTFFATVAKVAPVDVALSEGEAAVIVGYPRGESRTATDGLLGNLQSIAFPNPKVSTEYQRATPQIAGGNSGGALFHVTAAGDFEQIGVITATIPASDFMTYSTPIEAIHDFLGVILPKLYRKEVAAASPKVPG